MAGSDNLVHWGPGQSGNPNGSSQKAKRKARLRGAIETVLEQPIPDEILATAPAELRDLLAPGVTFEEAIAVRLVLGAVLSKRQGEALQAARTILEIQPDIQPPPTKPLEPRLPTTDERRSAILAELDIEETPETLQ